jgi:Tat protein secretion system quality control protein TatD with DNase activity
MILPFDSHNHVHLGPTAPLRALLGPTATWPEIYHPQLTPISPLPLSPAVISGMAIMSTHPRDFDQVLQLSQDLPVQRPGVRVVPCFGVHPWFLHELTEQDWHVNVSGNGDDEPSSNQLPKWIVDMETRLTSTPGAIVGEIGLDGFHFDPITEDLVSPMEKQVEAFRLQMELAARLGKPVSVHGVQSFQQLMEVLAQLKKSDTKLPPKIYFHAFGGKAGTVDQLTALCGRESGRVYFGFAPCVNFRSPKTAEIVRKVGIERLVIETDHEDAACVPESIVEGIRFLSETLEMKEQEIIDRTTANAFDLYGLS